MDNTIGQLQEVMDNILNNGDLGVQIIRTCMEKR